MTETGRTSVCRYYQSTKSSGLSSNLQPTGAKADHLREEMEEAANRMEICRVGDPPQLQRTLIKPVFCPPPLMCSVVVSLQDQLSADMYGFVAKEIDYASYFQTVSAASDQHAAVGHNPECV